MIDYFDIKKYKSYRLQTVLIYGWDFTDFNHLVPQQCCNGTQTCYPGTWHQGTFWLYFQICAMFLWHMYRHHSE